MSDQCERRLKPDEVATIANHNASADSTRVAGLACLEFAHKLRAAEKQLQQVQDRSGFAQGQGLAASSSANRAG